MVNVGLSLIKQTFGGRVMPGTDGLSRLKCSDLWCLCDLFLMLKEKTDTMQMVKIMSFMFNFIKQYCKFLLT